MKILSISPYMPSEFLGHAGAQTIYRNLISLSEEHEIQVLCFIDPKEKRLLQPLLAKGIKVEYLFKNSFSNKRGIGYIMVYYRHLITLLRVMFKLEPFFVAKYYDHQMIKRVQSVIDEFDPDIIHIEYNVMNHYNLCSQSKPCVLTEHDISTKLFDRIYKNDSIWYLKVKDWIQYKIWAHYEPRILKRFDAIITVTEEDRSYASKWKNLPPIHVIPPPISVKKDVAIRKIPFSLCFVGLLSRRPNHQVVELLINKIFPKLKAALPDITLRIAGKNMSPELIVLCENTEGIIYDGFVNEIDEYISSSSLFIAPIFIGAGLKMKITHSLACGTPVLTTPVGAEGIPFTEKDGLWVEDDIPSIIKKCIELFRQPEQLEKLSQHAKEKVQELFSQEVITSKLTTLYKRIIKEHRERPVSV
jgi:glycosyltransferase involved in cell wall biosynthesis